MKFGDVDGDGKTDMFVLTSNYGGHMIDHAGRELWKYENPEEGSRQRGGFEAPGLVWDFDRDGLAEAVHYQLAEGKEWLVVSDGKTGATKFRTEWPTLPMPHEYNNFRLAVGKLTATIHGIFWSTPTQVKSVRSPIHERLNSYGSTLRRN